MPELPFNDDRLRTAGDLRRRVSDVLIDRMGVIIDDSTAVFPFGGTQAVDAEYAARAGLLIVQLVVACVRDGRIDPRHGLIVDLHGLATARGVTAEQLFGFFYLAERTALDELALDSTVGATTEAWPLAAQLIRRASFDVLAAYAERLRQNPSSAGNVDPLTLLHTRAVIVAALEKELLRAQRFSTELAFVVFDIDRLSTINREHGHGVGDRVIERLGILVRKYFRVHDWVARHSEDSVSVLLAETSAEHALALAERVRSMVEDRLTFRDHRTKDGVRVTVSTGVVTLTGTPGEQVEVDRVLLEAEAAVTRAKQGGRNRVEHTVLTEPAMTIPRPPAGKKKRKKNT